MNTSLSLTRLTVTLDVFKPAYVRAFYTWKFRLTVTLDVFKFSTNSYLLLNS